MAVELSNRIQNQLGVDVPTMNLIGSASIASLAMELLQQITVTDPTTSADEGDLIVRFKPHRDAPLRLFCFPYMSAGPSAFRLWFDDLPSDIYSTTKAA